MAFDVNEKLVKLQGKSYLEVKWRLVWFRLEKPEWSIVTDMIEADEGHAIFKATILNEKGEVKATAHGSEAPKDFKDYLEKAETKAIGRALALVGYGTQFAPDLEEGERIVDNPISPSKPPIQHKAPPPPKASGLEVVDLSKVPDKELGEALNCVPFKNGKNAGKTMGELPEKDLEWLINAEKAGDKTKDNARMVLAWKRAAVPDGDEELQEEPPDAYMGFKAAGKQ